MGGLSSPYYSAIRSPVAPPPSSERFIDVTDLGERPPVSVADGQ